MVSKEKSKEELLNNALDLEKNGAYKKAVTAYKKIISKYPTFKPALISLASISFRMNDLDLSLSCYEKIAELGGDYLIWYNIGCIYYKQNKYKKSIIALEKSRRINENFVSSLVIMALSYGRLKNFKAAKMSFNKILAIDPKNELALASLSIIYFEENDYENSLEMVNRILKIDENNKHIRMLKVKNLSKLERFTESAKEMKAISNSDKEYDSFNNYVVSISQDVYTDKYGSIESKIDNLKKKTDESSLPEDFISLSLCCMLKGETNNAIDYLFKARQTTK